MIRIRGYREADTKAVARLISSTYSRYNGREGTKRAVRCYIKHYHPTRSNLSQLREQFLRQPIHIVAVADGIVIGVARGRPGRITSLFVAGKYHRKGVGRRLVQEFEKQAMRRGSSELRIRASLYAVPFYQAVGFKKSTGVRGFQGMLIQPMKKTLSRSR